MAHGMQEYEEAVGPLKSALFERMFQQANAIGPLSVLEVGIGTGPNLKYYSQLAAPAGVSVTGLEPNRRMWEYAAATAEHQGLAPQQLRLVDGDAQALPFEPGSFDAAVITLVLCSLPDPAKALGEVLRVLKPGAQLLLVEHVRAPDWGRLAVQQLLDPLQQLLADGCHLNRDTAAVVAASGFEPQPARRLPAAATLLPAAAAQGAGAGDDGLLRFEVAGMGPIAPHVAGLLRKPAGAPRPAPSKHAARRRPAARGASSEVTD